MCSLARQFIIITIAQSSLCTGLVGSIGLTCLVLLRCWWWCCCCCHSGVDIFTQVINKHSFSATPTHDMFVRSLSRGAALRYSICSPMLFSITLFCVNRLCGGVALSTSRSSLLAILFSSSTTHLRLSIVVSSLSLLLKLTHDNNLYQQHLQYSTLRFMHS